MILNVTLKKAKFRLLDGVMPDISVTHITVHMCFSSSLQPTCVKTKEAKMGVMPVVTSQYDMEFGHAGHWGMQHHIVYSYSQTVV